jgi:hypothetical protein
MKLYATSGRWRRNEIGSMKAIGPMYILNGADFRR